MKKQFYFMFAMIVAAMSFAFTSCSEEDTPVPAGAHGSININGQEYQTRIFDNAQAGYATVDNAYKLSFQCMFSSLDGKLEALFIQAAPLVVFEEDGTTIKGYKNPVIGQELTDVQLISSRNDSFFGTKGTFTATSGKVTVTDVTRVEGTSEGTMTLTYDNVKFDVRGTEFTINGSVMYDFKFLI